MKKSKRPKSPKVDVISNLPDPILHLILQRLPTTEEAIRTSVLSRRWRYVWTSIASLDIDCGWNWNPQKKFKKNRFKEFVYWILVNKTLDLERFRLSCSNYYNMSTVGRWIHAAVTRNVKVLDLTFCPSNARQAVDLPHCLVTCDSLTQLSLFLFRFPLNLPDFSGFSALRVLQLSNVELLDDNSVGAFLENCASLEFLSLVDCLVHNLSTLSISCPKLKVLRIDNKKLVGDENDDDAELYNHEGLCNTLHISCPELLFFKYSGHVAYEFFFDDLDSLKVAMIHPEDMLQKELSFESYGDTICELFDGVSHVESLSLSSHFLMCIYEAKDPERNFPASLCNLKTLYITTTIDFFMLNVIVRLLIRSPILESLSLIVEEENMWPEYWKIDEAETRKLLTRHLKRVEFIEFNGEIPKLAIIRFLLKYADALEEMVFRWCKKANYDEKSSEIMQEVSKLDKASSTVKFVALLKTDDRRFSI